MDLIKACESNDTEKARGLIMNNDTNLDIIDSYGRTALIWTILYDRYNTTVILKLIKTGHSKPEQVDDNGYTALIFACEDKMTEVALELIKTGHAKPEQINNCGNTALILACKYGMKEVALELIKTGHANLGHVDNDGDTALIYACQRNTMKEVALELIKTGKSNPDYIDNVGYTALSCACEKDMKDVAYELVLIGTFTINDLLFLKPEWVPYEWFIMKPVNVTEVDI